MIYFGHEEIMAVKLGAVFSELQLCNDLLRVHLEILIRSWFIAHFFELMYLVAIRTYLTEQIYVALLKVFQLLLHW